MNFDVNYEGKQLMLLPSTPFVTVRVSEPYFETAEGIEQYIERPSEDYIVQVDGHQSNYYYSKENNKLYFDTGDIEKQHYNDKEIMEKIEKMEEEDAREYSRANRVNYYKRIEVVMTYEEGKLVTDLVKKLIDQHSL